VPRGRFVNRPYTKLRVAISFAGRALCETGEQCSPLPFISRRGRHWRSVSAITKVATHKPVGTSTIYKRTAVLLAKMALYHAGRRGRRPVIHDQHSPNAHTRRGRHWRSVSAITKVATHKPVGTSTIYKRTAVLFAKMALCHAGRRGRRPLHEIAGRHIVCGKGVMPNGPSGSPLPTRTPPPLLPYNPPLKTPLKKISKKVLTRGRNCDIMLITSVAGFFVMPWRQSRTGRGSFCRGGRYTGLPCNQIIKMGGAEKYG